MNPSQQPRAPEAGKVPSAVSDRTSDDRWLLVQRVTQDESFRRAPRLRELLLFLTEKTLDGKSIELNEHEIARSVFRRAETFNSADDSIVRSSARQLRTKLHEYFEGTGQAEPVIIDIPKGSYVPEFPHRATAPQPVPTGPPPQSVTLWKAIALASVLVAITLGVLLARNALTNKAAMTKPPNLVTWLFGSRGDAVNVVLCDSALVVVNSYRAHMLSLDDYIEQRDQQRLPLPNGNPGGATPPEFPGKRLITSFRDMIFVQRLSELAASGGFHVTLKHSRLMQVRDFRTGDHILLGSPWSNPWTTLFEEPLTFRFAEDTAKGSFGIVNNSPKEGEQQFYQCTPAQAHNGLSYARIAIAPNLSGQGSVLLVSGLHTESSEGALDASLSPAFLDEIKRLSNARTPEELNGLELLLEVRAVDGVVHGTRLVASRQHRK